MKSVNYKGFSMFEVIVAITIIAVLWVIIGSILSGSFKGNSKTSLVTIIKQNGQTAINLIDQNIRNSNKVICPENSTQNSDSLTLLLHDGRVIRYKIYPEPANKSSNGKIQQDFPLIDLSQSDTTQLCQSLNNTAAQFPISLTDENPQNGVSLLNGGFNIAKQPGFRDVVTVQFNLKQGVGAPLSFENSIGGSGVINFSTTVQAR